MGVRFPKSAASQVFLVLVATVLLIATAFACYLVVDSRLEVRSDAEKLTAALAATVSVDANVAKAVAEAAGPAESPGIEDAGSSLQSYAKRVLRSAPVDFLTIMLPDGTRLTHVDPALIGGIYSGTIPARDEPYTEEYSGSLGPTVRTIVPIMYEGERVGWVSAGVTLGRIADNLSAKLPAVAACFVAVVAIGTGGAFLARRATKRLTGSLPLSRVHEAVTAYESIRPLRDALRVQTHEQGNRLHTVIALLELDRKDEAVELLLEHAADGQDLIDSVTLGGDDPTTAALLLQKAAGARDRGIAWTTDIVPGTPRSVLTPLETVTVLGNLIDNACEAAAAGAAPAWVNVRVGQGTPGGVRIVVRDSGDGISQEMMDRVFEFGFSTKGGEDAGGGVHGAASARAAGDASNAHGAHGRGVGLALVRRVVEGAGGTLSIMNSPTTVLVQLPEEAA